jgi:peptidoglycan/LPS O-acetylase OafA/YrhL
LVAGAISPGSLLYKAESRVATKLAGLSYAVYLTHKGIIHLVQQFFSAHGIPLTSNIMMVLCLIFVLLAALLLNTLVEKPFLRLRSRVLKRRNSVASPAGQEVAI